jgi:hypothetical protein
MALLIALFLACLLDPAELVAAFLVILLTEKKYIILIATVTAAAVGESLLFLVNPAHKFNFFVFIIRLIACLLLSAFSYWLYWSKIKKRGSNSKQ